MNEYVISYRRSTRWDPYPGAEPLQYKSVMARDADHAIRLFLGLVGAYAGHLPAAPVIVAVDRTPAAPLPREEDASFRLLLGQS